MFQSWILWVFKAGAWVRLGRPGIPSPTVSREVRFNFGFMTYRFVGVGYEAVGLHKTA